MILIIEIERTEAMDTSRNYAGQDYHVPTAETTNAPQNPSFLCVIEHHDAPNLQLFHIAYYCFVYIYFLHQPLVVANLSPWHKASCHPYKPVVPLQVPNKTESTKISLPYIFSF